MKIFSQKVSVSVSFKNVANILLSHADASSSNNFKFHAIFLFFFNWNTYFLWQKWHDQHWRMKHRFQVKSSRHWDNYCPRHLFPLSTWPTRLPQWEDQSNANHAWLEGCSWIMTGCRKIKWTNRRDIRDCWQTVLDAAVAKDRWTEQSTAGWGEVGSVFISLMPGAQTQSKWMESVYLMLSF